MTPIHAVFVLHDPRNWAPDVQICVDLLRYGSSTRAAFCKSSERQGHEANTICSEESEPVDLVFCNPDLEWRGSYSKPRLGQGGFMEALQGVYTVRHSLRIFIAANWLARN